MKVSDVGWDEAQTRCLLQMPILSEVEETSSDVMMSDLNERICPELLEQMNEAVRYV